MRKHIARTQPKVTYSIMSSSQIKTLLAGGNIEIMNARDGQKFHDPVVLKFSLEGRLDSFTSACSTLKAAEERFRFPFTRESDHAFLYMKDGVVEPSLLDGYALVIVSQESFWFGGKFDEARHIDSGSVNAVSADKLLDFLTAANAFLKEDTVKMTPCLSKCGGCSRRKPMACCVPITLLLR
jgi:hypothetical protein